MTKLHFMYRFSLAILILSVLQSCASTSKLNNSAKGNFDTDRITSLTRWRASGKVAMRVDGNNQSANFEWKQSGNNSNVHLFGPLGQGSVRLTRQDGQVCLQQKSEVRCSGSAEDLLQNDLDWRLPVAEMAYWIKGIPSPKTHADYFIPPEQAPYSAELGQLGWKITYKSYQVVDGLLLPRKLTASRGTSSLTIVVKHWEITQ